MVINLFKFIYLFRSLFICMLFIFYATMNAVEAPISPMPNMSAMSEEDMSKFMGELESTAKEIDNFVSSLPPAEQEEFNRAVQEVEQMINDMSPEELEQFIGDMFGAPGTATPQPEKVAAPEPIIEETKVKKVPKLTKRELSEQEEALDLINAIIKKTESFMIKAQAMPELAGKTKRWGKKARIRNWQADRSWNQIKIAVDRLVQKLHKMKDKDPKTNQYKFIKDFIEDKALYNNLGLLRSILDQYESSIEVSPFGIEKMPTKAKNALQQIISSFTESLYVLKTPEALNKIIAKYEPRAKELAEEEKKIEEQAKREAKRPLRAEPTVVGGIPESNEPFYGGNYDTDGYGGGYGASGYGSTGPSSAYTSPSYATKSSTPSRGGISKPVSSPGSSSTGAVKKPTATKDEKSTVVSTSKEAGKKAPSKAKSYTKTKEMAAAEVYLDDITNDLSKVIQKINSTPFLSNVKNNLPQEESQNVITENIFAINEIMRNIKKITDDYIKRIRLKVKTAISRKIYKQKLEKILEEITVDKKTIKPKEKLDALLKQLDNIEAEKSKLSIIKQFAYFGGQIDDASIFQNMATIIEKQQKGEELNEQEQETQQKYEKDFELMQKLTPSSLPQLRDTIQDLLNEIKDFDKEKKSETKKVATKK